VSIYLPSVYDSINLSRMSSNTDRNARAEVRMRKKVVAEILESVPEYMKKVQCDNTIWTQPFKCAVISCRHVFQKFDPNAAYKFHNFPADPELQQIWLKRCRVKDDFNPNSAKVCTDHFLPDDYERNFKEEMKNPLFKRKLKPTAIPSQLLEGMEVSIVDFINMDGGICEVPDRVEVRRAVDENLLLKERFKKLTEEKELLCKNHYELEKRLSSKRKKIHIVKNQYEKLKKRSYIAKEQKNLLSRVFSQSQINVLLGKKKVFWSNDDMAMAFTLRQMGNKECYLYLKKTLNVPLPSLSSIQKWTASK